jgi:predicted metal-dependent HD superfamily phosphohydrolase
MGHGLAWLGVVGCLLWAAVTAGAPPPGGIDKETAAAVRKLQEKRRDLLREALEVRAKLYQAARAELGEVLATSKRLLEAELDLAATGAERIAAYEKQVERAEAWVEIARAKQAAGRGTGGDVLDAQAFVLEAQIGLLKAGGKVKEK